MLCYFSFQRSLASINGDYHYTEHHNGWLMKKSVQYKFQKGGIENLLRRGYNTLPQFYPYKRINTTMLTLLFLAIFCVLQFLLNISLTLFLFQMIFYYINLMLLHPFLFLASYPSVSLINYFCDPCQLDQELFQVFFTKQIWKTPL